MSKNIDSVIQLYNSLQNLGRSAALKFLTNYKHKYLLENKNIKKKNAHRLIATRNIINVELHSIYWVVYDFGCD